MTDADGRARSRWTLGDVPGRQRLMVGADHLDSVVAVVGEADPVAANVRAVTLNGAQSAHVSEALAEPVGVRLTDSVGRALIDIPVSWTTLDGGTVVAANVRTDTLGEAHAQWTLGARNGTQRVRAQLGSGRLLAPVTITAVARSGAPASAMIAAGDAQQASVATTLRNRIVLRVVDKTGNGVEGIAITLSPTEGGVADSAITTDSTGTASVKWTLGRVSGTQRLLARVDGLEKALTVTAKARPRGASNLTFDAAPDSGTVGKALHAPVAVTVTDAYGNPISDAPVRFSARAGSVSAVKVMTDEHGRATTRWTLGTRSGEQTLSASVAESDARATLAVQGVARLAPSKAAEAKREVKKTTTRTPPKSVARTVSRRTRG